MTHPGACQPGELRLVVAAGTTMLGSLPAHSAPPVVVEGPVHPAAVGAGAPRPALTAPAPGLVNLGGSVHDPTDPVGRLLFNVLAMVAEFEADLARMRTREGMKVAKAKGRLRGKQPKLSPKQEAHLVALHQKGEHTISELEELFSVTRSTVYRAIARGRDRHVENQRA